MVVDILPVPAAGSVGIYVAVMPPLWFRHLVDRIYSDLPTTPEKERA